MSSETSNATAEKVARLRKISMNVRPNIEATDQEQEDIEQECREVFALFDKDNDGHISMDELVYIMRLLDNNPTEEDLQGIMKDLDKDGNGKVEFEEFLKVVENHWKQPIDEEQELRNAFKVFDRNGDGYVVASEIQYVMHHLGHDLTFADVERIMKRGDSNADGRLDYNEFVGIVLQSWREDEKKTSDNETDEPNEEADENETGDIEED